MEDVLVFYTITYEERCPMTRLDKKPVVQHADVRPNLPTGHSETHSVLVDGLADCGGGFR